MTLKRNFNHSQEIDDNGQNSHAGKPKDKAQIIHTINTDFHNIMLGAFQKDLIISNIAHQVYQIGQSIGLDQITILKATINEYHKVLSNIMTDEYRKKLKEPINLANLLSMKG